jgi:hypothetical protein
MDKLSSAWVYVVEAQCSNWANVNPQVSKFERAQCCNQKKLVGARGRRPLWSPPWVPLPCPLPPARTCPTLPCPALSGRPFSVRTGSRFCNPTVRASSQSRNSTVRAGSAVSIKTRNRRQTHRQTHTHVVIIYRIWNNNKWLEWPKPHYQLQTTNIVHRTIESFDDSRKCTKSPNFKNEHLDEFSCPSKQLWHVYKEKT